MTTKRGIRVTVEDDPQGEERPPCLCGCGGTPKGKKSRFIPGHDARYHAAQKKAAAEASPEPPAPANTQARPPAPSRRRKAKDGATESAGSEA
jgi:hypothetical protein